MGKRCVRACDVHFSTALHHANHCFVATLDENNIVREAESSGEALDRALGGRVREIRVTVAPRERCGMLFAAFSGS